MGHPNVVHCTVVGYLFGSLIALIASGDKTNSVIGQAPLNYDLIGHAIDRLHQVYKGFTVWLARVVALIWSELSVPFWLLRHFHWTIGAEWKGSLIYYPHVVSVKTFRSILLSRFTSWAWASLSRLSLTSLLSLTRSVSVTHTHSHSHSLDLDSVNEWLTDWVSHSQFLSLIWVTHWPVSQWQWDREWL